MLRSGTPHYVTETPGHLLAMSLRAPGIPAHYVTGPASTLSAHTPWVCGDPAGWHRHCGQDGCREQRSRSQGVGVPQLPLHHLGRAPQLRARPPHGDSSANRSYPDLRVPPPPDDSCSESRHRRAPGSVSPSSRDGSRENHRCPGDHPARGMGPLPAARPASGINLASPGSPPRDTSVSPGTFQSAPYYTYEPLKQEG